MTGLSKLHPTCPEQFCKEKNDWKPQFHHIWISSGSFLAICLKKIRRGSQKCIPLFHWNNLNLKIVFKKKVFLVICGKLMKNFWKKVRNFSMGLLKLHSTCPWKKIWGKMFPLKNLYFINSSSKWSGFYLPFCWKMFDGVVEIDLCVSIGTVWAKIILLKKLIFWAISDDER